MDTAKVGKTVARRSGLVSLMTMLSRITGLIRDVVIASYFGAGFASDAFLIALSVPNLLRRNLAEGSFAPAFVPILTDELADSDEAARRAIGSVASFVVLVSIGLAILGIVFATPIVELIAPGFSAHPGKSQLATSLLRILLPFLVMVSLLALSSSALNTLGVFGVPASAAAILNSVVVLSVVGCSHFFSVPIYVLAWGTLVGGGIALLPQVYLLRKRGFPLHFAAPHRSSAVWRLAKLALPALFSTSVLQLMVFFNRVFASLLSQGSVSWYYFADRIVQFPLGVVTMAVATAILPTFSRIATRGEDAQLNKLLTQALTWLSFVTLPATAGLILLAQPIVAVIYQRGSFTAVDASATAGALVYFSLGLWPISCQVVIVLAYLSKKNTRVPAIVAVLTLAVNMVLAIALMGPPENAPTGNFLALMTAAQSTMGGLDMDHRGLALASSIASLVQFLLLFLILPGVSIHVERRVFGMSFLRSLSAAVAMIFAVRPVLDLELGALPTLLLGIPLGVLTFFVVSLVLGNSKARTVLRVILRFWTNTQ